MNTPNPPTSISISRRLWRSLAISLDQQETPGTEDVSEEIIHTTRAGNWCEGSGELFDLSNPDEERAAMRLAQEHGARLFPVENCVRE